MDDEARYGNSEHGKATFVYRGYEFWRPGDIVLRQTNMQFGVVIKYRIFKYKDTTEAAGYNVVGTRTRKHNHEGNLSTALARRAVGT